MREPHIWSIESSEYAIADAGRFSLRRDRVLLNDGRSIDGYLVLEFSPWVTVIPVTADDEIVLVRQYRHALGEITLELPGGGAIEGEDPRVAGARELLEETGYGAGDWRTILRVAPNPALQNNWDYFVVAEGVTRLGDPQPDETEDLLVELHPQAAIPDLIAGGEITHVIHVAALLTYLSGIEQAEGSR